MMPSSWFYKLRSMRRAGRSQSNTSEAMSKPRSEAPTAPSQIAYSPNRASYYLPSRDRPEKFPPHPIKHNPKLFDTHFPPDTPRSRPKHPTATKPYSHDVYTEDDADRYNGNDIVFDVSGGAHIERLDDLDVLKAMPELKLRPILTKPSKNESGTSNSSHAAARSPATRIRRFKVRPSCQPRHSRKEAAKKAAALPESRRWLYESLVVVKSSADPERDFLESMAEMIVENDIRSSNDLEELLACYLSLNSAEYHRVIVGVFQRVWFDLARKRLQD